MATKLDGAAGNEAPRSKSGKLKHALLKAELAFIMEAHNGLSAKVVEEAGFEGIWASGLAMSAALGVRDNNEASWTQVLEQLEFMADATQIPILVDGDTGYGNFNNVRRLVKKLCQRGIAGVCIEDKLFPKTNSFIGEGQPLADIEEFAGRIKAGKDSQEDGDFQLVARVEALISGWGMDEALRRAEAYHAAGADGILIHSKKADADEILTFSREWAGRAPLVIVPTMYYATPTDAFRDGGVSLVIWANHNLRAALSAMRDTSRRIMEEQSLASVEGEVASVKEIFHIVGQGELAAAEARYLKPKVGEYKAILLAASRGSALGPLTERTPKCMLDIRGEPLLQRLVTIFNDAGLREISVVRGYRKEMIDLANVRAIDNDAFAETGEAASLECAADQLDGASVLSYGDILFRPYGWYGPRWYGGGWYGGFYGGWHAPVRTRTVTRTVTRYKSSSSSSRAASNAVRSSKAKSRTQAPKSIQQMKSKRTMAARKAASARSGGFRANQSALNRSRSSSSRSAGAWSGRSNASRRSSSGFRGGSRGYGK